MAATRTVRAREDISTSFFQKHDVASMVSSKARRFVTTSNLDVASIGVLPDASMDRGDGEWARPNTQQEARLPALHARNGCSAKVSKRDTPPTPGSAER